MSRRLLSIAALILAVTASGLSAQEAENQVPTYEDLPEGALYFKEDHKDWRIRCQKNSAAEDSCQMFQLIVDGQGSPVAQIVFFDIPAGEGFAVAGATITVPLLTALSEDFLLQIDDHPPKAYPYAYCDKVGCYVRLGVTPVELNWLKSGTLAKIATVPYRSPDQRRVFPISLSGFTSAYDALIELSR